MTGDQIRKTFLDFFAERGHLVLPSASLVPVDDPSLLMIGAGMAPFKPYFTGIAKPPAVRVCSVQKCIRTPDIENVGKTGRHATCFEMLGNFSFGDYFKKEAIRWAWEFLTQTIELDANRLYITVHRDDQEAYAIWRQEIGVAADHIFLGDQDNFWEVGIGPCGPDSEIFYDQGPEFSCGKPDCGMGCSCDRYLEIWNLVFTQFDRDEDGNYHPLERKCIDTGLGLDRLAAVLQSVPSVFEIDLNRPVLDLLIRRSGVWYDGKSAASLALKIIVDHVRGVTFMIGDGILPGNEGRGYVLRRLLRRAVRYGRLVGLKDAFMAEVAGQVIDCMKVGYPDLAEKRAFILKVVELEEKRFGETLESGLALLQQYVEQMKEKKETCLNGSIAFKLHDTFGFPLELTEELLAEQGMSADIAGFQQEMTQQRNRARAARQDVDAMGAGKADLSRVSSRFTGYQTEQNQAVIVGLYQEGNAMEMAGDGEEVDLILDRTPFYAESGGQVGDTGYLESGELRHTVRNTLKESGVTLLKVKVNQRLGVGDQVLAVVDHERRLAIARHHSATHLLQQALRQVLGEHLHQAGSEVSSERIRFDFSHFSAVEPAQLQQIEHLVNAAVLEDVAVVTEEMPVDAAKNRGAMALFGEKYGKIVRVVGMGSSLELCGGTHVQRTGQIGSFKILSEAGIGSGLRRIEAVAGWKSSEYFAKKEQLLGEISGILKSKEEDLPVRLQQLLQQNKELGKKLEALQAERNAEAVSVLLKKAVQVAGVTLLVAQVKAEKTDDLRQMADVLRDKMGSGIVMLGSEIDGNASLLAAATKDLNGKFHAGNLIREIAKLVGGGGGGRPDLAQAGGKNPEKLPEALQQVAAIVAKQLQK
ncbi:MAG: alanine--tRNA ligase [Negativicutes bacterium]|nr:alanine--tRNA ligase [Negativicutes bacterium]